MDFEEIRKALLIPSPSQWARGSQPTKQTTVSYILAIVGLTLTFGAGLYTFLQPEPAMQSYNLSEQRRTKFLELLRVE